MKHRNNAAKLRGVRANLETKRAETEYAVDVENLAIKYVTMAHTVEAVNDVSFKLKKKDFACIGIIFLAAILATLIRPYVKNLLEKPQSVNPPTAQVQMVDSEFEIS